VAIGDSPAQRVDQLLSRGFQAPTRQLDEPLRIALARDERTQDGPPLVSRTLLMTSVSFTLASSSVAEHPNPASEERLKGGHFR